MRSARISISHRSASIGADGLQLGKTVWPSAVAGSNGAVIQSGAITLLGQDGVTVTHNHGSTSYLVKTNVTGLGNLGRIGDIAYVKAANTVVIYNSGISGISADVEISAVASASIGADGLQLGKTVWPSAVAGSNGAVIQSGAITLLGQDGVTVTHNHGSTSYLVKTNVTGLGNLGRIGDIAYVKAANTVVIYNSGISGISADVEISAVA